MNGYEFLHFRNSQLQSSSEVEDVIEYLRASGDRIPNEPSVKIEHYIGFLSNRDYVDDGVLTGNVESIELQIEAASIELNPETSNAYIELQTRRARDEGRALDISDAYDVVDQAIGTIQDDQRERLREWAQYLSDENTSFPNWFKYYVYSSVIKLGSYNQEKQTFDRRSKKSFALFPALNRASLTVVYNTLLKRFNGETIEEPDLAKAADSGNFALLYAAAIKEVLITDELKSVTEGSWRTYKQSEDPKDALKLSSDISRYETGWCTAGPTTAEEQLKGGDFLVFYTVGKNEAIDVPRIAIRMEHGHVAEVRGINKGQELEPELYDEVDEKLETLPGGEEHKRLTAYMRHVLQILNDVKAQPDIELSTNDLLLIYGIDREVMQSFGYDDYDPRLETIINLRPVIKDLCQIFDVGPSDQDSLITHMMESGLFYLFLDNYQYFPDINPDTIRQILKSSSYIFAKHPDNFTRVTNEELAVMLIDEGYADLFINNHEKFFDKDLKKWLEEQIYNGIDTRPFFKGTNPHIEIDKIPPELHDLIARVVPIGKWEKIFSKSLSKITGLSLETAKFLIYGGLGKTVVENIDIFGSDTHEDIIELIIDNDLSLMSDQAFITQLNYLSPDKRNGLLTKIMDKLDTTPLNEVAGLVGIAILYLEEDEGLRLSRRAIDEGWGDALLTNIYRIPIHLSDPIARRLLINARADLIRKHREKFTDLDPDIEARIGS